MALAQPWPSRCSTLPLTTRWELRTSDDKRTSLSPPPSVFPFLSSLPYSYHQSLLYLLQFNLYYRSVNSALPLQRLFTYLYSPRQAAHNHRFPAWLNELLRTLLPVIL